MEEFTLLADARYYRPIRTEVFLHANLSRMTWDPQSNRCIHLICIKLVFVSPHSELFSGLWRCVTEKPLQHFSLPQSLETDMGALCSAKTKKKQHWRTLNHRSKLSYHMFFLSSQKKKKKNSPPLSRNFHGTLVPPRTPTGRRRSDRRRSDSNRLLWKKAKTPCSKGKSSTQMGFLYHTYVELLEARCFQP